MRSKLYLVALAAITFASCSNDDIVTQQTQTNDTNEIAFRAAVPKSRAEETTINTLKKTGFWVQAIKEGGSYLWYTKGLSNSKLNSLAMLKFEFDENRNQFVSQIPTGADFNLKWPAEGNVTFYAMNVDPTTDAWWEDRNFGTRLCDKTHYGLKMLYGFEDVTNVPDQVDFVYSTNKGSYEDFGKTGIPLTFKHPHLQLEVQAYSNSADFDVIVKGYKIHYLKQSCYQGYMLPASPVTYGSEIASNNVGTQPTGQWTWVPYMGYVTAEFFNMTWDDDNSGDLYTDYFSGFYGGYESYDLCNDSETKSSDVPTEKPWITLGADAVQISNGDNGTAMLLPSGEVVPGYDKDTKVGAYIALLVQINDKEGKAIYPAIDSTTGKRICYKGLPKYFGYVYFPISSTLWLNAGGKKVLYCYGLNQTVGRVDPDKPATVDPDTYDPETDTNPGTGGADPYNPGDLIVPQDMRVNAQVEDKEYVWTSDLRM